MAARLQALEEVTQKWRALAEGRRTHLVELYHSGRWKRYYNEEQFLRLLREAIRLSERWAEIAPCEDARLSHQPTLDIDAAA